MSIVKVYLLKSFSYDELRDIANFTKQHEEFRRSGKTALVASTDLTFGLGRMYDTLVEIENLSHSVKVFRPMDEAIKWLGEIYKACLNQLTI